MASADNSRDDNAAIAKLLLRHRTALYAYIFACVRHHSDAEEILQEVAVTVVAAFEKLAKEEEFLPWAREIARRHVLSFFRRSSRPLVYDSDLVGLLSEAARDNLDQDEGTRRTTALRDCLENMPPKSQEIMRMRYDGSVSSVEEIAQHIGRTMAATYGILKRLRLNLRTCIERKLAASEL
jgi:RNA polymerase sigma-70 factor, ECF subfamily